jgi:ASC-1-like (ASCH) protein
MKHEIKLRKTSFDTIHHEEKTLKFIRSLNLGKFNKGDLIEFSNNKDNEKVTKRIIDTRYYENSGEIFWQETSLPYSLDSLESSKPSDSSSDISFSPVSINLDLLESEVELLSNKEGKKPIKELGILAIELERVEANSISFPALGLVNIILLILLVISTSILFINRNKIFKKNE